MFEEEIMVVVDRQEFELLMLYLTVRKVGQVYSSRKV